MGLIGPYKENYKPEIFGEEISGELAYRSPGAVDTALALPMFQRWRANLKVFEGELEKAAAHSDEEFMGIGVKLDDFHSRSGNILSMSSAAAGLLKGGEIRTAIAGLKELLESVRNSIGDSERDIERFVEGFSQILGTVRMMKSRLANIDSVCRSLRKHSTTMKIYSAQLALADKDCGPLAGDVKKLSEVMEVKAAGIGAELDALGNQVSQTIAEIQRLGEKHRSEIAEVLRRMASSVASLNKKHEAASAMAVEIREMSRETSGHISNIVSSVQFHDITNQQLQRAKAMVCNLGAMLEAEVSASHVPERSGHVQVINAAGFACGIEADHLSSAERELNRAVKEIVFDLVGIADSVSQMSRMVLEMSLDSGGSLLEDIKSGLTVVSAAFFEITENKKEFSRAAESAMRIEKKIRSFMSSIEEIGDDISIIALNAGIKAAQIGNRGAAVSIIANSMQRVLAEARGLTDTVLECNFSVDLSCDESDDVDAISSHLQSLLGSINQVDEDLSEVTKGLSMESRSLSEDISLLAENMSVHDKLSVSIDRVVTGMMRVMEECEPFFPAGHFNTGNLDRNLLEAQLNRVASESGLETWEPVPESVVSLQRVHEQGGTVEFF